MIDFGAEKVVALVVEKKDGAYRILGGGESEAQGIVCGQVRHIGDAVESLVEALRKAERSSGVRASTLYFNWDDPDMQSAHVTGSKSLTGEGQIDAADVAEARQAAERLVGDFEKSIAYSRETGFLIDGRDKVLNPVGVFGQKLDVNLHVLLSRAARGDVWKKLFQRAQVSKAVPVLTAWSVAWGVLPPAERSRRRLIMDLGRDYLNAFVYENDGIRDYALWTADDKSTVEEIAAAAVSLAGRLLEKNTGVEQVLVTGDLAHNEPCVAEIRRQIKTPLLPAAPAGVEKLEQPRFASLAGLVAVAEELEKRVPLLDREKGMLKDVKEKVTDFLNEYF